MIKLTYGQISGFEFTKAFQKLAQTTLPTKVSYSVKKIGDALNQKRKEISKAYTDEIVEKFAKRDEKGEKVSEDPGQFAVDDAQKEAFQAAQDAFGKTEFTLDREKIRVADLEGARFSAAELTALDSLLTEETVAEKSPTSKLVNLK